MDKDSDIEEKFRVSFHTDESVAITLGFWSLLLGHANLGSALMSNVISDLKRMGYFVAAERDGSIRAVEKHGLMLQDLTFRELRELLDGRTIEQLQAKRD